MPTRTLILNGAGAGADLTNLIAVLDESGQIIAERKLGGRGASEHFAPALRSVLQDAASFGPITRIVAVIGPGSFTGLRASLSLAAGLAAGWNCPTIGVTLGHALRATLNRPDATCISIARRGRYFVDPPSGPVYATPSDTFDAHACQALTGDATNDRTDWPCPVVSCLAPSAAGILLAAETTHPGPLTPLYVDPPEAKPPAAGLRPLPT